MLFEILLFFTVFVDIAQTNRFPSSILDSFRALEEFTVQYRIFYVLWICVPPLAALIWLSLILFFFFVHLLVAYCSEICEYGSEVVCRNRNWFFKVKFLACKPNYDQSKYRDDLVRCKIVT